MRVATYIRISTDEDHQPYSLEAQAERLAAYVKSQPDWELTRRFSDQASGATTERPELKRALAEARAGRFDLLLVYQFDRFSRSVRASPSSWKTSTRSASHSALPPSRSTRRPPRGG